VCSTSDAGCFEAKSSGFFIVKRASRPRLADWDELEVLRLRPPHRVTWSRVRYDVFSEKTHESPT